METLIEQLPKYADLLQKAGVIGILLVVCGFLLLEVIRLRKQAVRTFAERDAYRLGYVIYKSACDREKITVDTSALQALPIQLPAGAINVGAA